MRGRIETMRWSVPAARLHASVLPASLVALLPNPPPAAPAFNAGLQAPALSGAVVCRNVRERLLRPNGRFEYVTRQDCMPDSNATTTGTGCRIVRERVIRRDGTVQYLSVNRCN